MSKLRDIINRFIDTQALLQSSDFGEEAVRGLHKIAVKSKTCTNIDLSRVSFNSINKLANSTLYTGEQLVDMTEDMLRSSMSTDISKVGGSFFAKVSKLNIFSDDVGIDTEYSNYTARYASMTKDYNAYVSRTMKLLNDQNSQKALHLDDSSIADMSEEMNSILAEYKDALEAIQSLNKGSKLVANERLLANVIEARLRKRLLLANERLDIYERAAGLGSSFDDQVENLLKNGISSGNVFRENIQDVVNSWRSSDFVGIAKNIAKIARNRKQLAQSSSAKDLFMQGLGAMAAGFTKLELLSFLVKGMKYVFGALIGINEKAAEFNKSIIEAHGLVSMGIDLNPNVKLNSVDVFNKFRELYTAFGADTKSFLQPEKLMALTSEYEKAGIKLKDLTKDTQDFNSLMATTLSYSVLGKISMEDLARIQANWRRNLSMDVKSMNVMLDKFLHSSANMGVPMEMLIDNLSDAGYEFSMWNDSMASVIELQSRVLGRKDVAQGASKDAFKVFGDYINKMEPANWSEIADALPANELMEIIAKDEARLEDKIKNATDESERKKAQHILDLIRRAKSSSDPIWLKKQISDTLSAESRFEILKRSLNKKFGGDLHRKLKDGAISMQLDSQLKAIFHFSGSTADWQKIKLVLSELLDPNFKSEDIVKKAKDMHGLLPETELDKLSQTVIAAYQEQTTIKDMFLATLNKYANKLISVFESIRAGFRRILFSPKLLAIAAGLGPVALTLAVRQLMAGDDPNDLKTAAREDARAEILKLAGKYGTEKDANKRQEYLKELSKQAQAFVTNGGDIAQLRKHLQDIGLNDASFINSLDEGASKATPSDGKWETVIKNINPARADIIIKTIKQVAAKVGADPAVLANSLSNTLGSNAAADTSGISKILSSVNVTEEDIKKSVLSYFDTVHKAGKSIEKYINKWPFPDQQLAIAVLPQIGGSGKFGEFFDKAKTALKHDPSSWEEFAKASQGGLPPNVLDQAAKFTAGLSRVSVKIGSNPLGNQAEGPSKFNVASADVGGTGASTTHTSTFSYNANSLESALNYIKTGIVYG